MKMGLGLGLMRSNRESISSSGGGFAYWPDGTAMYWPSDADLSWPAS